MEQRTLTNLRSDVRIASDTESQTLRHPDAELDLYLNEGYRAYRSLITSMGFRFYLTSTAATTLVGTEVANETYHEVSLPTDLAQLRGVDIQYSSSPLLWVPLKPITQLQRRDYQALPPIVSNASYKLWYLPNPGTLTSGTDVLVTPPEGLAWVTAYAAVQVCSKDDDPENTTVLLKAKIQEIEARTMLTLPKTSTGGALKPRYRGQSIGWADDPGYYNLRLMPEGSGSSVTVGKLQLFLRRGL